MHITNGIYGTILVEPEGGLSEVDREFYAMRAGILNVSGDANSEIFESSEPTSESAGH